MELKYAFVILVVAISMVGTFIIASQARRSLQRYWQRRCTGRTWRRTFPSAPTQDIRAFLRIFVESFAFPSKRMLQFAPSDSVSEIYRSATPVGWPDALELETLEKRLQDAYGLRLRDFWRENLTLGEIFARSREKVA
jgi:hypothetical protein